MRDPDLVVRAQVAASALEEAWHRWRVVHGVTVDPGPTVSCYVGYSLQEPWGQPRVVFGLAAQDAERLTALIERHDRGEPAYAAAANQSGAWALPVPAPRQAPLAAANMDLGQPLADVILAGQDAGYDEPVYRQAAAAMKEAAAARVNASRVRTDGDDSGSSATGRSNLADLVSPEWMGSLAMAAFTARSEAEARIRAVLTKPDADQPDADLPDADLPDADLPDASLPDASLPGDDQPDGPSQAAAESQAGAEPQVAAEAEEAQTADGDDSGAVLPHICATDVLESLPAPEAAPEANLPGGEEAAIEFDQDDQDDQDEVAPTVPSDEPRTDAARRGSRVTRNRPIARLSKTKRPGASSRAAGS